VYNTSMINGLLLLLLSPCGGPEFHWHRIAPFPANRNRDPNTRPLTCRERSGEPRDPSDPPSAGRDVDSAPAPRYVPVVVLLGLHNHCRPASHHKRGMSPPPSSSRERFATARSPPTATHLRTVSHIPLQPYSEARAALLSRVPSCGFILSSTGLHAKHKDQACQPGLSAPPELAAHLASSGLIGSRSGGCSVFP